MSVYSLMKYQIFLVQTVERILIKKNQCSCVNNYFYFVFLHLLYRLFSWYFHLKTYALMFTLNRYEIGLLFTWVIVATTNISRKGYCKSCLPANEIFIFSVRLRSMIHYSWNNISLRVSINVSVHFWSTIWTKSYH